MRNELSDVEPERTPALLGIIMISTSKMTFQLNESTDGHRLPRGRPCEFERLDYYSP